ncbi:hypothetical protein [Agrobacterium sp. V1]|uniref:hypothetical protein n=1 Tax=Agrobacterium sp. V1 TaxID=3061957 RepID=UPI0026717E0C|nr:hypothetical protein [Agrobacterium sp. V1]MDO3442222.1 hypothetical protein [Agrobacterium sp. V1]
MKDNSRFYIPVLSFLVLASVVLLARYVSGLPDDIQAYVCKAEDCTAQEWLSATAGWIGFAAAAVGAYIVFGQLEEQKKQTAFMLGDAPPSIELFRTATKTRVAQFDVTNWNRRRISIAGVKIFCAGYDIPQPSHVTFKHPEIERKRVVKFTIDEKHRIQYTTLLGGWLDRGSPPPFIRYNLHFDNETVIDYSKVIGDEQANSICVVALAIKVEGKRTKIEFEARVRDLLHYSDNPRLD